MLKIARKIGFVLAVAWPGSGMANGVCEALGHLLLATDLMRVAAATGLDLEASYGPSIRASIASHDATLAEDAARDPEAAASLLVLRDGVVAALLAEETATTGSSELAFSGQLLGRQGQQYHAEWQCGDAGVAEDGQAAPGGAVTERPGQGLANGERRLGTAVSFRSVLIQISRENRVERAVLIGCGFTVLILLPYLIIRDRRRQRRARRYTCLAATSVVLGPERITARFFDVSQTGARLMMPKLVPPGSVLTVEILEEARAATVVRSGEGFAGVQFENPLSTVDLKKLVEEGKRPFFTKNKRGLASRHAA